MPAPWRPDEPHGFAPELKAAAAAVVHGLLNHEAGVDRLQLARDLLPRGEGRGRLGQALRRVVVPGTWSRAEVEYVQLGGYSDPAVDDALRASPRAAPPGGFAHRLASTMVLVRQEQGGDGDRRTTRRVLDLRFVQPTATDGWQLRALADDGGPPTPRPGGLPPVVERVLDDERIDLPDSARWDLHEDAVAHSLLRVMLAWADRQPFSVLVLGRGHPFNVFNTDRVSRHTVGHAVDVHRVDGTLVAADRAPDGVVLPALRWLYDLRLGDPAVAAVANLGGPVNLDPVGGRSFTDSVHQDHFHVSVPTPGGAGGIDEARGRRPDARP